MFYFSVSGFGDTVTCAQTKFEMLSETIDNCIDVNFQKSPRRDCSLRPGIPVGTRSCRYLVCEQVSQLLRLAGASSVQRDSHGLYAVWPGATPWRVVASEFDLAFPTCGLCPLDAVFEEANPSHLVEVSMKLFEHIGQEDVRRALDIERRNALSNRRGGVEFTVDDAFVEELKLRVLRVFQSALESSPSARLLRSMGLPMTSATDDELLSDGPSLGQDEEHFLTALDADLRSHWQVVAQ